MHENGIHEGDIFPGTNLAEKMCRLTEKHGRCLFCHSLSFFVFLLFEEEEMKMRKLNFPVVFVF